MNDEMETEARRPRLSELLAAASGVEASVNGREAVERELARGVVDSAGDGIAGLPPPPHPSAESYRELRRGAAAHIAVWEVMRQLHRDEPTIESERARREITRILDDLYGSPQDVVKLVKE